MQWRRSRRARSTTCAFADDGCPVLLYRDKKKEEEGGGCFFCYHSLIMPFANDGLAIRVVRARDGTPHAVLSSGRCLSPSSFALLDEPVGCEAVVVDEVPAACFVSSENYTGGLGRHTRWTVPFARGEHGSVVEFMCVSQSSSSSLRTCLGDDVHVRGDEFAEADGCVACVAEVQSRNFAPIAARLLAAGCELEFDDSAMQATYLCEKLDRAEGMWVNQFRDDATFAGPLREGVHWNVAFIPNDEAFFTWPALAHRVCRDVGFSDAESGTFPAALRWHMRRIMRERHAQRTATLRATESSAAARLHLAAWRLLECRDGDVDVADAERAKSALRRLSSRVERRSAACRELYVHAEVDAAEEPRVFMSKLTAEQETQLLSAFWHFTIGPPGCTRDACRVVLMAYFLEGYMVRAVSSYHATGLNVGRSGSLRALTKQEYRRENLPTEAINRAEQSDGFLRGPKSRGSRVSRRPTNLLPTRLHSTSPPPLSLKNIHNRPHPPPPLPTDRESTQRSAEFRNTDPGSAWFHRVAADLHRRSLARRAAKLISTVHTCTRMN